MSTLGQASAAYAGDRGDPDPEVRELLRQARDGRDAYLRAVAGLCTARLLAPIVAVGDDGGTGPDPGRHAAMHAVQLATPDGQKGMPVFTGLDALVAWRADARPVPCRLDEVSVTAAEQQVAAILVDLAGPDPLVLEAGLFTELARGRRLVELPDGGWGWLFAADSSPGDASG